MPLPSFGPPRGKWHAVRRIKAGGFGAVYLGEAEAEGEESAGRQVAIKVETITAGQRHAALAYEARVLQQLASQGLPEVLWSGSRAPHNALVMELLGPDMETLMERPGGCKLHGVLGVALQLLDRLDWVHRMGFTHCDVKPANLLLGVGPKEGIVYLCDFGIARHTHRGRIAAADAPAISKENLKLRGTDRYLSIGAHENNPVTPWDDLESAGYSLVEMLRGELPWDKAAENAHSRKGDPVLRLKRKPEGDICRGLPPAFAHFLKLVRAPHSGPPTEADRKAYRAALLPLFAEQAEVAAADSGDWGGAVYAQAAATVPAPSEGLGKAARRRRRGLCAQAALAAALSAAAAAAAGPAPAQESAADSPVHSQARKLHQDPSTEDQLLRRVASLQRRRGSCESLDEGYFSQGG
eukprot:TRINITY_DN12867_c0_g1_i1.p1 TRINITY_DN12867_c0_g1~~TRINITY_DN12867_c0_g1_i1.p1  ORF type:complete len:410 (+),score=126.61 TRINITY_DN12867_c0_g1_i1:80-1309(+)